MQPLFSRLAGTVAISLFALAASAADLKITTQNTMAGNTTQGTTYIKGSRQRTETQMGPVHQVVITQCDRRQTITVSDACRTYLVAPMDEAETTPPPSRNAQPDPRPQPRLGGTLTINNSTSNTGETRPFFGYTARHIKSTMTMTSSPDACNQTNMKIESDGWYADFSATGATCSASARPSNMGRMRPDCQDRIRQTGSMRSLGYPMKLTTTMQSENGTFTMTQETTEISKATLDPALFDVPAGYRQVNDYQGLMCRAATDGSYNPPPTSTGTNQDDEMRRGRRGGRGPLCVAPITSQAATSFDHEAWRDTLISELQRVRVESVRLESNNQFDLRAEAAEKGCRYVLYTDVMDLKQPSHGRRYGNAAGVNANYQSTVHEQLEPMDDFVPRLDKTVTGLGANMNDGGQNALRIEAQDVAAELSDRPR
ncbi:MAG: hypothetical protein HYX28_07690 [Candidatus Koribacter versatilis]|uniref:Uncharacterized protein n=1 Tax=Candidatus Korobacter versatilis TaxID=658062 RepID=A0A932A8G8_9BACT|nr:hypothetical protein [Candidatus Koribacter versatilis]